MQQLRDIAHDGRTVIVVTHSVLNLGTCDRLLILAPGGQMAFYGPPSEALPYFGAADWADVYQALPVAPPPQRRGWARQTLTLTRRYANVIWADRGYVLFMGLLPLILGGLI